MSAWTQQVFQETKSQIKMINLLMVNIQWTYKQSLVHDERIYWDLFLNVTFNPLALQTSEIRSFM